MTDISFHLSTGQSFWAASLSAAGDLESRCCIELVSLFGSPENSTIWGLDTPITIRAQTEGLIEEQEPCKMNAESFVIFKSFTSLRLQGKAPLMSLTCS